MPEFRDLVLDPFSLQRVQERQNLVQKGQKKLPVKDSIEKEEIGTAIVSSSDT